jgi:zinc transporter 1/2/3
MIKLIFMAVVFLIVAIAGALPVKVACCKNSQMFLGLANSFSGGLFLSIALLHILPDVEAEF